MAECWRFNSVFVWKCNGDACDLVTCGLHLAASATKKGIRGSHNNEYNETGKTSPIHQKKRKKWTRFDEGWEE